MSSTSDTEEGQHWLYDIVKDRKGNIIAICYHQEAACDEVEHPNCVSHMADALVKEGLRIELAGVFSSLESARKDAWKQQNKFAKGLD